MNKDKSNVIRRIINWAKTIDKSTYVFVLEIVLMLMICIVHSLRAGYYVDFNPVNGTYQNFNPVRRLMAGQIPYRDFQDYLGMGHLYTGTIATALFGGNYKASLEAFSFLTFGGLGIFSLLVCIAILKKKEIAGAITNIFLLLLLLEPAVFKNAMVGTDEILSSLEYALSSGNSARFVRGMILPIACLMIYAGYKLCDKWLYKAVVNVCSKKSDKNASDTDAEPVGNDIDTLLRPVLLAVGIGIAAGLSFPWSNDYGISCWLCLAIMTFWLFICRRYSAGKVIIYTAVEVITSLIVMVLAVEVFTLGHLGSWFSSTFGTGGYQSWYYNSPKSHYLYDADISFIMLLQAGIAVVYLVKMLIARGNRESLIRYGIPGFANMVCFCASNEYKLLSGGTAREVALSVLFFTIAAEIIGLISGNMKSQKVVNVVTVVSVVASLAWTGSTVKDVFIINHIDEKEGMYIEELGGNIINLGYDLQVTRDFIAGEDVFATYATAQEVVDDKFQPSGTDYIIHVLGDEPRETYMNAFRNGNHRYAATIRESFNEWEYWVQRANWYFYRELYQNWHPVYANAYELYWERNEVGNSGPITEGFNLSVVDVDDSSKKLVVQCDNHTINGVADVLIDYQVEKKDNLAAKLTFKTYLRAVNTGTVYGGIEPGVGPFESNYLRGKSAEYIPVRVVNGYGEVTITSDPTNSTYLVLNGAMCGCVYTVPSDYLTVSGVVNDGGWKILVENNQKNLDALNGVKTVVYGGSFYDVEEVTSDEWAIYVKIKGELQSAVLNQMRLIR